ncbi:hypothetical protein C8R46DRAFT_388454 [Mycena filopes]|nr:hypothetical protein C8R46DRAFT_388454 [Mycena filopes]
MFRSRRIDDRLQQPDKTTPGPAGNSATFARRRCRADLELATTSRGRPRTCAWMRRVPTALSSRIGRRGPDWPTPPPPAPAIRARTLACQHEDPVHLLLPHLHPRPQKLATFTRRRCWSQAPPWPWRDGEDPDSHRAHQRPCASIAQCVREPDQRRPRCGPWLVETHRSTLRVEWSHALSPCRLERLAGRRTDPLRRRRKIGTEVPSASTGDIDRLQRGPHSQQCPPFSHEEVSACADVSSGSAAGGGDGWRRRNTSWTATQASTSLLHARSWRTTPCQRRRATHDPRPSDITPSSPYPSTPLGSPPHALDTARRPLRQGKRYVPSRGGMFLARVLCRPGDHFVLGSIHILVRRRSAQTSGQWGKGFSDGGKRFIALQRNLGIAPDCPGSPPMCRVKLWHERKCHCDFCTTLSTSERANKDVADAQCRKPVST